MALILRVMLCFFLFNARNQYNGAFSLNIKTTQTARVSFKKAFENPCTGCFGSGTRNETACQICFDLLDLKSHPIQKTSKPTDVTLFKFKTRLPWGTTSFDNNGRVGTIKTENYEITKKGKNSPNKDIKIAVIAGVVFSIFGIALMFVYRVTFNRLNRVDIESSSTSSLEMYR